MNTTSAIRKAPAGLPPIGPLPGLLVSVRDASEARDALAGGAGVIDVKEPDAGPLGAASTSVIASVVGVVAGAAPITVATGEIGGAFPVERLPPGVAVAKVGVAGAGARDWRAEALCWASRLPTSTAAALVAYADWQAAQAPAPEDILTHAAAIGCCGFVVDTWSKEGRCSLDLLPPTRLRALVDAAIERRLSVVLAGSVTAERVAEAASLRPTLVGVRGAACAGGRSGVVDRERVRVLAQQLDACRRGG